MHQPGFVSSICMRLFSSYSNSSGYFNDIIRILVCNWRGLKYVNRLSMNNIKISSKNCKYLRYYSICRNYRL